MRFKDSSQFRGWIGLYEPDEDGHLAESYTFRNVKAVRKYIKRLINAIEKYEETIMKPKGPHEESQFP